MKGTTIMQSDDKGRARCSLWKAVVVIVHLLVARSVLAVPANDSCENATAIAALPFDDVLAVDTATTTGDQRASCVPSAVAFVWYTFTPTDDGMLEAKTCDSNYDTVLAVYSGDCGQLTPLGCNDD